MSRRFLKVLDYLTLNLQDDVVLSEEERNEILEDCDKMIDTLELVLNNIKALKINAVSDSPKTLAMKLKEVPQELLKDTVVYLTRILLTPMTAGEVIEDDDVFGSKPETQLITKKVFKNHNSLVVEVLNPMKMEEIITIVDKLLSKDN